MERPIYIYKITNLENEKVYIGRSVNPKKRLKCHIEKALLNDPKYNDCPKLYNSIRAYGKEAFGKIEIVAITYTFEEVCDLETFHIKQYNAVDDGLNCTYGGQGGMLGYVFSEESKNKMSVSAKRVGKARGIKNPTVSITENDVRNIKIMIFNGISTIEIENKTGITAKKIRRIKRDETWTH